MLVGGDALAWIIGTVIVLAIVVVVAMTRRQREHFVDLARDSGSRAKAFAQFDRSGGAATFTELRQQLPDLDAVAFTDLRSEWNARKK